MNRASMNGAQEDVMNVLFTYLRSFVRKDEGQDLLEYALLVALIAIVCTVGVGLAGGNINELFSSITDNMLDGAPAAAE